jgi:DNA-binding MarR family transcriptional regulator
MDLKKLFMQRRAPYVLLALEKAHTATEIAKKIDMMQSNVSKILADFNNFGITEKKKVGRTSHITLTERGREIASAIKELRNILEKSG